MKNEYTVMEDGKHALVYINCKGKKRATMISLSDLDRVQAMPSTWYGVVRNCSLYVQACFGKPLRYYYLHRWIMEPGDDEYVDHGDNDGMNNTRENLSKVTAAENNDNRRLYGTWDRASIEGYRWYEAKLGKPYSGMETDENGYLVFDDMEPLPFE